jgi:hypothetical protein
MAARRQIGNLALPEPHWRASCFDVDGPRVAQNRGSAAHLRRGDDSLASVDQNEVERFAANCVAGLECRGTPDGGTLLPTILPRPRRVNEKRSLARIVFDFVFNTALVTSALIFAFIVLVREEQHAFGQPEKSAPAVEQSAPRSAPDITGETQVIPPSE